MSPGVNGPALVMAGSSDLLFDLQAACSLGLYRLSWRLRRPVDASEAALLMAASPCLVGVLPTLATSCLAH